MTKRCFLLLDVLDLCHGLGEWTDSGVRLHITGKSPQFFGIPEKPVMDLLWVNPRQLSFVPLARPDPSPPLYEPCSLNSLCDGGEDDDYIICDNCLLRHHAQCLKGFACPCVEVNINIVGYVRHHWSFILKVFTQRKV